MGCRCSSPSDDDEGNAVAGGLFLEGKQASLAEEAQGAAEQAQHHPQLPASPDNLMADSAALEGWRRVQHLQFQAFTAAADTCPNTLTAWHSRNAFINCLALVCKGLCRKLLSVTLS